jgi:hypothetical protein
LLLLVLLGWGGRFRLGLTLDIALLTFEPILHPESTHPSE